jgi:glycosyltransferase involved in cell wall biosynthesis
VRLLLTIQYFDEPDGRNISGLQVSTRLLAQRLIGRGHRVSVLCGMLPGGLAWTGALAVRKLTRRPVLRERDDEGIHVITAPVPDLIAEDVVAALGPDAILASGAGDLNRRVLRMSAPGAVYRVHSVKAIDTLTDPEARPHSVIAVSPFIVGEIARLGIAAEFVPSIFETPQAESDVARRADVLFVNPVPEKGLEVALALAARRPDVRFRFARAWPLSRQAARSLRRRTRPLPNVSVTPPVPVRDLYRDVRLLLAPSLIADAWARVITEAQMHGVPVLASNAGGLVDAVSSGGIVIDAAAPIEDWHSGFSAMWDDASTYERLSAEARRSAARPELDPDRVVARIEHALAEAAGR